MPHRTRSTRQQTAILSFARATKPGTTLAPASLPDGKKTKNTSLPVSPSKKRKLNEVDTSSDTRTVVEEAASAATVPATPSKTLRLHELTLSASRSCRDLIDPNSPTRTRTQNQPRPSLPSLSPSRRKQHNTTTAVRVRPESNLYRAANTKVVNPSAAASTARPASFTDLLNLHSSVLKALSIHAAHNGRASPADLREFLRSVERIWKKRKVVTQDLQRLLWVWKQGQDQDGVSCQMMGLGYRIANYGLGRICLEREVRSGDGQDGFCYDDKELQERFEEILERLWVKHQAVVVETERKAEVEDDLRPGQDRVDFVECLGLAPIYESLTPLTSFRKGQQRLQDLKGGVIRAKLEKVRAQTEDETSPTPVEATVTRKNSLLDRLKNKKLQQSKLPPPPSNQMLLRRAAAQRVEEVVGIMALLRPTAARGPGAEVSQAVQRKAFSLDTVVQHIRDSIRNPIPRDEVETCLDILAQTDVAGHWVGMVTVNQMKSVVLKSCENISPKEIGQRVYEMKIGYEESAL